MFHFCHEEFFALLSVLGVGPYLLLRLRALFLPKATCAHTEEER